MANIWDWIKRHGLLVIGAVGGLAAIYLLFVAPSSPSSGTPSTTGTPSIGFPGGGGGTGTVTTPTNTPTNTNLPYSPDFSLLNNITNLVLRGLYSQLYNAEVAYNNAYVQNNTSLMNTLAVTISSLQTQINNFKAKSPGNPGGPGIPGNNVGGSGLSYAQILNALWFMGQWVVQNANNYSKANLAGAWQQTWAGAHGNAAWQTFINTQGAILQQQFPQSATAWTQFAGQFLNALKGIGTQGFTGKLIAPTALQRVQLALGTLPNAYNSTSLPRTV